MGEYLSELMADERITHLVYVPWMEEERDQFRKANAGARII